MHKQPSKEDRIRQAERKLAAYRDELANLPRTGFGIRRDLLSQKAVLWAEKLELLTGKPAPVRTVSAEPAKPKTEAKSKRTTRRNKGADRG